MQAFYGYLNFTENGLYFLNKIKQNKKATVRLFDLRLRFRDYSRPLHWSCDLNNFKRIELDCDPIQYTCVCIVSIQS